MYHGPIASRPVGGERPQRGLALGTHREVVVDDRHLPVEQEVGEGRVGVEAGQQVVEQLDQPQPEGLERQVPLAVPVGVGDDRHLSRLPIDLVAHGGSSRTPHEWSPQLDPMVVGQLGSTVSQETVVLQRITD